MKALVSSSVEIAKGNSRINYDGRESKYSDSCSFDEGVCGETSLLVADNFSIMRCERFIEIGDLSLLDNVTIPINCYFQIEVISLETSFESKKNDQLCGK